VSEKPDGGSPPPQFPDDGAVSRYVRVVDNTVGRIEQGLLFALLAAIVLTAASAALSDKLIGHHLGRWWFTTVRGGTFTIAMFAAAFATHQQRHLAMDLVSRRLPPRGRLMLRLFLGAVTIFVVGILMTSFWRDYKQLAGEHNANNPLPAWLAPSTLPIGGGLVIFHTLLHLIIDVDYLVRGKLPPERARSAH